MALYKEARCPLPFDSMNSNMARITKQGWQGRKKHGATYKYVVSLPIYPKVYSLTVHLRNTAQQKLVDKVALLEATITDKDTEIERLNSLSKGKHLLTIMSASTARHLVVALRSIQALNPVDVQRGKLTEQLVAADAKPNRVLLFTPLPGQKGMYQARPFRPRMSGKDAVTGSAAGPLTLSQYLYRCGLLGLAKGNANIQVYRGSQVGPECVILVTHPAGKE